MMKLDKGSRLGNYKILSSIGIGGFALVYLGEHIYLQTQAAIKVLHFGPGITDEDLQRFITEARTIAQLRHPHIVNILEFGVEDSVPYLVMEYAPHGSLRSRHPKGSILPLPTVVAYVQQVAAALQYAHEHKVVHCDVKPENMLLGEDDGILLSDFGIARVVQNTAYTAEQGGIAGTVYYMAPEQFAGKPVPASDQYTLGVVAYQWLCGQLPFEGKSMPELLFSHTYSLPPPLRTLLPELPPAVEQVILKALAKKPHQRFPSVQAFATALEEAAELTAPRRAVALPSPSPNGYGGFSEEMVPLEIDDTDSSEEALPLLPQAANIVPFMISPFGEPTLFQESDEASEELLPLLPPVADSVLRGRGPSREATVFQEPGEPSVSSQWATVASSPPEPNAFTAQWKATIDVDEPASVPPLLPSPSTLLPSLEVVQEEATQRIEIPPMSFPKELSESLLLPSITSSLPQEKMPEENSPTVLVIPSLPEPPEPVEALPLASSVISTQVIFTTKKDAGVLSSPPELASSEVVPTEPVEVLPPGSSVISTQLIFTSGVKESALSSPPEPVSPEPVDEVTFSLPLEPISSELAGESTLYKFFISYVHSDEEWAWRIAQQLEEAGYSVVPSAETSKLGTNFAEEMQEALIKAEHVIVIVSPMYLRARSNQSDWTAALRYGNTDGQRRILPVCIEQCGQPFGKLLNTSIYIDLLGMDEQATRKKLLNRVNAWLQPTFIGGETIVIQDPEAEPDPQKIKIFISYSHFDRTYRTELNKYLKGLKKIYPAVIWDDGEIRPGVDFEREIEKHLREAHIILLLVSQNFIASDYCSEKELKTAMERHYANEARVIPVILKPALWKDNLTPFGKLQALPHDGRAITGWNNRGAAYVEVAEGIQKVIIEMLSKVQ